MAADVLAIAQALASEAEVLPQRWPDLEKTLAPADTSNIESRYCVRLPSGKRGRKRLLVETLRSCYAVVTENFRISAGGADFVVAVTDLARESNITRAVKKLRESVETPDEVYAIPFFGGD